jgi:4'-phosphopantetheinyl transferase
VTTIARTPLSCAGAAGPRVPRLEGGLVQLWTTLLVQPPAVVTQLYETLSGEERARADGYRFARHRHAFIVARGVLRTVLGTYLGAAPERVPIGADARGKPMLIGSAHPPLTFNLAHGGGRAVYAVALDRPVGVDVESAGGVRDLALLAERICSPRERAALDGAADPVADALAYWTCKEAYLKACGIGLALEPSLVDIELGSGGRATILSVGGDAAEAERWGLERVQREDQVIAVVARGRDWRLE